MPIEAEREGSGAPKCQRRKIKIPHKRACRGFYFSRPIRAANAAHLPSVPIWEIWLVRSRSFSPFGSTFGWSTAHRPRCLLVVKIYPTTLGQNSNHRLEKSAGRKISSFSHAAKTSFYQNSTPKISANACGKNGCSSNPIDEMILSKAATSPRRNRAARRRITIRASSRKTSTTNQHE